MCYFELILISSEKLIIIKLNMTFRVFCFQFDILQIYYFKKGQ